jgi:hypothetical protein
MRCYQQQHRFYCGADLHARTMFTHVLDHAGQTVFAKDLPTDPASPDPYTAPLSRAWHARLLW